MDISEEKIKKYIIESIKEAYGRKIPRGTYQNPLRSKIFVSELGKRIYSNFSAEQYMKNFIEINEDNSSIPGEWLLDIFITRKDSFSVDKDYPIRFDGIWAVESEFRTGYGDFTEDFCKLLCVKCKNNLYVNGVDELTINGRRNYIASRLNKVQEILNNIGIKEFNLIYCFCPSPNKYEKKSYSFWDLYRQYGHDKNKKWDWLKMYENENLFDLIEVYKFTYSNDKYKYMYNEVK